MTDDGYFIPEADAALRQVVDTVPVRLVTFSGHTHNVEIAAFSPDGQTIVTASADKTARVWPSVEALLQEAEFLIQRDPPEFTPEELARFGLEPQ